MMAGREQKAFSTSAMLWGICSSRMFTYSSLQSYAALLPVLQKEWQMSNAAAGSIVSAFQVGFLVSLVGLSVLTDWVSARKVFLYSCIAFAVSGLLFALLPGATSNPLTVSRERIKDIKVEEAIIEGKSVYKAT